MNPPESIHTQQNCDVCNVKFVDGQRKISWEHTNPDENTRWLTTCRECNLMCGCIRDVMKNKEVAIKCVKALQENIKIE